MPQLSSCLAPPVGSFLRLEDTHPLLPPLPCFQTPYPYLRKWSSSCWCKLWNSHRQGKNPREVISLRALEFDGRGWGTDRVLAPLARGGTQRRLIPMRAMYWNWSIEKERLRETTRLRTLCSRPGCWGLPPTQGSHRGLEEEANSGVKWVEERDESSLGAF